MGARGGEQAVDAGARLAAQEERLRLLFCHLAGRAVRARVEIDDLVQEVFLRALAMPGGLPPADPARPGDPDLQRLLGRLARNTVVDVARALRARKRDRRETPLERSDWSRSGSRTGIAHAGPGPATRAVASDEARRMLAAFQALSPDHRRVIGLRQLEGLSAADAGRRLGRSETAVHSLYRRALEAWEEASRRAR